MTRALQRWIVFSLAAALAGIGLSSLRDRPGSDIAVVEPGEAAVTTVAAVDPSISRQQAPEPAAPVGPVRTRGREDVPLELLHDPRFDVGGLVKRAIDGDPRSRSRLASIVATCRTFGAHKPDARDRLGDVRAAAQGDVGIALLTSYEKCLDVPEEFFHLEHDLLMSAARAGDTSALRRIRHHPPPGTAEERAEWVAEVLAMLEAASGDTDMLCVIASIHAEGVIVEKDLSKAVDAYRRALERPGDSACQSVARRTIEMLGHAPP